MNGLADTRTDPLIVETVDFFFMTKLHLKSPEYILYVMLDKERTVVLRWFLMNKI